MTTEIASSDNLNSHHQFIENNINTFKNMIYQNIVITSTDKLHRHEYSRYIYLCQLIKGFCNSMISNNIDYNIKSTLSDMYFNIYKKTPYYRAVRKFHMLLLTNNIVFEKHMTMNVIANISIMMAYLEKQLLFIQSILNNQTILKVINKQTIDDFMCKMIFICTVIINYCY